jgi:hypothetical protein
MTSLLVLSNDLAAYLFNHAASPPYVHSNSTIELQDPILSSRALPIDQIAPRKRAPNFLGALLVRMK